MGLSGCGGAQCGHHGERFALRIKPQSSRVVGSVDEKSCTSVSAAGDFVKSEETAWQATLDINLRAVLVGAHVATQIMRKQESKTQRKGASATLPGSPLVHCAWCGAAEDAAVPIKGHSPAAAERYLEQGACKARLSCICLWLGRMPSNKTGHSACEM